MQLQSPYAYGLDNPIRFIDPDGMYAQAFDENALTWGFASLVACNGCKFMESANSDRTPNTESFVIGLQNWSKQFEEKNKEIFGDKAQQELPKTTFEVLHSARDSFGWDWFLETSQKWNRVTQTSVIIIYNTDREDWGTSEYGKVVATIVRSRSYTVDFDGTIKSPPKYMIPHISPQMRECMTGASDYHCDGCLSGPTLMDKYLNFILSPSEEPGNRLNATSSGQRR